MKINVHELINLPHGEANKKIKEAGKWDELAGKDYKHYYVDYTVTTSYTDDDVIQARSKEEVLTILKDQHDIGDEVSLNAIEEVK